MNNKKLMSQKYPVTIADIAGIGTWTVVFGLTHYFLQVSPQEFHEKTLSINLLFIVNIFCFVLITRDPPLVKGRAYIFGVLGVQLLSSFILLWYIPLTILSILTIIWVSLLPHYFTTNHSIMIMIGVVVSWFALYAFHWNENVSSTALLYISFHFFAIAMTHQIQIAEKAAAEAQRLNTELLAIQQLLSETSRQNERTRIARDLHDLLGHHLTALIINLQVAGYLTEGKAKSKIEQSHSLAKLLLSDVREAVTTLRENQGLDFHKMVDLMVENIFQLKITNNIDTQLNLEDLNLAKSLLYCIQEAITNSLRHSNASGLWITMKEVSNTLILELIDNGQIQGKLIKGNGLKGMCERVEELKGHIFFNIVQNSLQIRITIPLPLNKGLVACNETVK